MQLDKKLIARNFDKYAHQYDENARIQTRVAHELVSRIGEFEGEALDVGAGTGIIKQIIGKDITQIDLSPEMCKISGAICADAEDMPFEDNSFDLVVSSLTIQWLNDLKKFCEELARVLKKNGRFSLSTFAPGTFQELAECYQYLDGKKHLIDFTSSMKIFAAMKMAGLEGVEIHSQNITYQYRNLKEILGVMKNIGATYPVSPGKGLKGKKHFEKLENIYKAKFEGGSMLPVTWQVLYASGRG